MMTSPDIKSQLHYRTCNYCEAMCGITVHYDPAADCDDKKNKVTPDKNDPFSKGAMCPKASALVPLHFDPDRLKRPGK